MKTVCSDLADKVHLLEARSVVDAALKDTATMTVGTDSNAMLTYSIEDELSFRRLKVIKALLNDVVTVEI